MSVYVLIEFIRRQQDKYKSFMTCSVKGCTAPPFADPKEFKKHRQESHGFTKHDHTNKTPCPLRGCGRHKQSRGFLSQTALQEHMKRSHGIDAPETNGTEPEVPDDEALAAALQVAADVDDEPMAVDQDSSDEEHVQPVEPDEELSVAARRHMEHRLAQMEKEREKIDREIAELRMNLHGTDALVTEQAAQGAEMREPIAIPED